MESFICNCPSVLNSDHAWKHIARVNIKFSNLISFREEVKFTFFMAVNYGTPNPPKVCSVA